jgi:hypothetical protein
VSRHEIDPSVRHVPKMVGRPIDDKTLADLWEAVRHQRGEKYLASGGMDDDRSFSRACRMDRWFRKERKVYERRRVGQWGEVRI